MSTDTTGFDWNPGQLRLVGEEFRHGVELALAGEVRGDAGEQILRPLRVRTVLACHDLDLLDGELAAQLDHRGAVVAVCEVAAEEVADRLDALGGCAEVVGAPVALEVAERDAEEDDAFGGFGQRGGLGGEVKGY